MSCECMKRSKAEMTYDQLNAANNSACNNLAICKEKLFNLRAETTRLRQKLEIAITGMTETIEDNLHLADGDNCTLIKLKQALSQIRELEK